MKKLLLTLLASVLAAASFADTVQDITAGKDLSVRCTSGTFTISGGLGTSASGSLVPSTLVHVTKAANTLVATVPTGTLLNGSGISTNLTFTGAADATTGGINWTVTDPGLVGQNVTVTYNGTPVVVTVTGVSGNVYTVGTHVVSPVFDSFDSVYRGTMLQNDASQTSSVTVTGTAEGIVPVSITINPVFAGMGGEAVTQFVNHVLLSTASVVSGEPYTGTVYLESAVTTNTTVSLSSNLAATSSVVVLAGQKQATFSFTPGAVYSTTPSWIRAIAFGTTADEAITALPLLASISVNTAVPLSGAPVSFTVHLNGNAPTGGLVVHLSTDDQDLVLPSSVTVPAGTNSVSFTATPSVVSTSTSTTGVTETYVSGQNGSTIVRAALLLH